MITQTRNLSIATVLIVAIVHQAGAQTSRVEVSGGYAITHAADQLLPFGWSADIATNLNRTWSMVGEVSGAYKVIEDEDLGVDVNLSLYSLGAGARWSSRVAPRIVPFVQSTRRCRASQRKGGDARQKDWGCVDQLHATAGRRGKREDERGIWTLRSDGLSASLPRRTGRPRVGQQPFSSHCWRPFRPLKLSPVHVPSSRHAVLE